MPVSIAACPAPSISSETLISVSLVFRSTLAVRPIVFPLRNFNRKNLHPVIEARLHRARVIVQTFEARELRDFRRERFERALFGVNHRGALEKIVSAERRKKTRAAARRQNMIGSGQIVAQRRRRIGTEEDRAGV